MASLVTHLEASSIGLLKVNGCWGVAQLVEGLPSVTEDLGSPVCINWA